MTAADFYIPVACRVSQRYAEYYLNAWDWRVVVLLATLARKHFEHQENERNENEDYGDCFNTKLQLDEYDIVGGAFSGACSFCRSG
ncbi:MAG: hypothetical protein ACLFUS_09060 [Candidatus Sumerlaeia bacterium]